LLFLSRLTKARVVGVAALACAGLLAAPVGSGRPGKPARKGGIFRIAIPAVPGTRPLATIDPGLFASDRIPLHAVCEFLMGFPTKSAPAGFHLVPEAAASYPEVSRDGKTYTFTVRKGIRFHTGERLAARNFAYAINRVLNPRMRHPAAPLLAKDIEGGEAVLEGRTETAAGVVARGNRLTIRLTRPSGDFPAQLTSKWFCPVPVGLPIDPEGVGAPFGGAGPYYIAGWTPGRELVLRRNPFYGGIRARHVDQTIYTAGQAPEDVRRAFERGEVDWAGGSPNPSFLPGPLEDFVRMYGINKSQLLIRPAPSLSYLALNTERPLFKDNAPLRRAVNFAVDRRGIVRLGEPHGLTATDQYLPPIFPGFRNVHIYPLRRPNFERARALARGRTRGGKAILYTINRPFHLGIAAIVKDNLRQIGLDVEVQAFPGPLQLDKLRTRGEPFDIGLVTRGMAYPDPFEFFQIFEGRSIAERNSGNVSYFNSTRYDRLIARAERLPPGAARYRAFGALDIDLARNEAPMVAVAHDNMALLFSKRVGCVYHNGRGEVDLAALCLK
jgi:oligopeptide transport system substrate-binding protein